MHHSCLRLNYQYTHKIHNVEITVWEIHDIAASIVVTVQRMLSGFRDAPIVLTYTYTYKERNHCAHLHYHLL